MESKVCYKCHRELPLTEFYKNNTSKDGLDNQCKLCRKEYHQKYYAQHKSEIQAKAKQYYIENKEFVIERSEKYASEHREAKNAANRKYKATHKEQIKRYELEHKEQIKETRKKYKTEHKDQIRDYGKKYRSIHKDEITEYSRKHRRDKRDHYNQYNRAKYAERYENDDLYKFKVRIRGLMGSSFRRKSFTKNSKTYDILGCSFEEALDYLYRTWEKNYGAPYNGEDYHIDHVIPLSTARTEEDVIKLFHISNLQLLKPEDNMVKSDKLDWSLGECI